jgi:hypothetical protein
MRSGNSKVVLQTGRRETDISIVKTSTVIIGQTTHSIRSSASYMDQPTGRWAVNDDIAIFSVHLLQNGHWTVTQLHKHGTFDGPQVGYDSFT